jgi:hypothetical protein
VAVAVHATFKGSSTATTTSWAPTVTGGTGTASGDRAIVVFTSRDHTSGDALCSISDNSGDGVSWTLAMQLDSTRRTYVWTKVLNSSHDGDTITVTGAIGSCAGVLLYLSGAGAFTSHGVEFNNSGDESVASVTPAAADSMVFASVHNNGNDNSVSAQSWATLGGATGVEEHLSTGGSDCATSVAWRLQVGGPSATGAFTWAQTNGTTYVNQFSVAPAAAGGSTARSFAVVVG